MLRNAVLAAFLALGCASAHVNGFVDGPPTPLEPREVLTRARAAFHALAIPVAEDDLTHTIYSGVFSVTAWWDGEPVADRIDCGTDKRGEPLAATGPVDVQIQVIADDRGAPRHPRTYVEILGAGTLRSSDHADAVTCDLTLAFRNRLRRSIVDDPPLPRPGGGWTMGGPYGF
jgi:hypothetical protein